jgi:putative ABC transport system substrate-binding protein
MAIDRRQFLSAFGGAAAAWPLRARAQQPSMPVVGFLSGQSSDTYALYSAAFHHGLNEEGYIEGRNVAIEYRFAAGQYNRLPALATDLVQRQVTVIAAISATPAALAAKRATETIPIVFAIGSDPVEEGLVASLNRPGGNVTGVTGFNSPLATKRLEILRKLAPKATALGVLINPSNPQSVSERTSVPAAAQGYGLQTAVFDAGNSDQIDQAFAVIVQMRLDALYVSADPLFVNQRAKIVALAATHAIPAIYDDREIAEAGGLVSYGGSRAEAYRQAGIYVGRILKGEKPGDLPVVLPTKFEMVLNLKAAKALSLAVPAELLALADEVIE